VRGKTQHFVLPGPFGWQVGDASDAFEQIWKKWDKSGPELSDAAPIDHLRAEYRAVLYYTAAFPEFHRFMRQDWV
jgi:TetR/AcrR family transcriptional regulator